MATATVKLSVTNPPQYSIGSNTIAYYFNVSFSANTDTYATGGITMNLAQVGNLASTSSLPLSVWVYPTSAQASSNQSNYLYVQGTTQANGKLQCFVGAAEKTNAQAMNAGNNEFGQTLQCVAEFSRR